MTGGSWQLCERPDFSGQCVVVSGNLTDQMVKQWGYIRSYLIKDGHLFLSLMADGGIYEFEPVTKR